VGNSPKVGWKVDKKLPNCLHTGQPRRVKGSPPEAVFRVAPAWPFTCTLCISGSAGASDVDSGNHTPIKNIICTKHKMCLFEKTSRKPKLSYKCTICNPYWSLHEVFSCFFKRIHWSVYILSTCTAKPCPDIRSRTLSWTLPGQRAWAARYSPDPYQQDEQRYLTLPAGARACVMW
jgi:hypothetical protein